MLLPASKNVPLQTKVYSKPAKVGSYFSDVAVFYMFFVHNADNLCDAYLERGVDGSFLARPSKGNPGDFTLSGEIVLRR
jgi:hypothetical protein